MTARIRYLAFLTDAPDVLAAFYKRHLALEELGQSAEGDVSLTDGFYNLTFLKRRAGLNEPRTEMGLHHIGIAVDRADCAAVKQRYRTLLPHFPIVEEQGGLHFGDFRIFDPEGLAVSVSASSFGMSDIVERLPRLRHIAYNSLWPEGVLDFFVSVFGFREVPTSYEYRKREHENRFCGDGATNLALHPFYCDYSEGHEARYGVNHFGFLVPDVLDRVNSFSREIKVASRPSNRPFAEYRLVDPEGNRFDLSQTKGWEIDVDAWARAS